MQELLYTCHKNNLFIYLFKKISLLFLKLLCLIC